jgi:hypothetical protein
MVASQNPALLKSIGLSWLEEAPLDTWLEAGMRPFKMFQRLANHMPESF